MLKAVLFDLDETLLDFNLRAYLQDYNLKFSSLAAEISGLEIETIERGFLTAISTMMGDHDHDLFKTNLDVFCETFFEQTGIDLSDPIIVEPFNYLYDHVLSERPGHAGPKEGMREVVEQVFDLGLEVVLATNPTFPLKVTWPRLAWANVQDLPFKLITSAENSRRCKPHTLYYQDISEFLGIDLSDCLMVGDSLFYDIPDPACKLKTFTLEPATDQARQQFTPAFRGSKDELLTLIKSLM